MPSSAISSPLRFLPIHRLLLPLSLTHSRTFIDARIQWVRDRGLDHAVEKEKHLFPFHSLKDFLLHSLPSSSTSTAGVPLDSISDRRQILSLPFRAIRFIRLFPNAFIEENPNYNNNVPPDPPRPSIRPTDELLRIHSDELTAIQSSRADAADRLLRLLMLSPYRRLPLPLIDRLRWDLGLPCDFVRSLLPDFPDYFQISPSVRGSLDLELVCYRKDLAVSAMENYAVRTGGYKKGDPLAFPLRFSRGFELEKKVRKWVDEWQKLPYISPYESGSNLPRKSDFMEKWMVGTLHEVLSLMIGKKTDKVNLILLGKHLGLPSEFRRVVSHHPGIFYLSNKLKMQTVVLREAYRRDLLIEKHPMMGIRYQYIHLMHKNMIGSGKKKRDQKSRRNSRSVDGFDGDDRVVEGGGGLEDGVEMRDDSDDDLSEVSDFESEDDESDEDDEVIETNCSPAREIQPRRSSPIRASSIERKLHTSKTRLDGMHKVGRRNSMGEKRRAPSRTRIST